MQRKTVEFKGSYTAVDDQRVSHRINVYVDVIHMQFLDGSSQRAEGMQSHKMAATGGHVNVNGDGTIEEVATGSKMRPLTPMPA